MKIGVSSYSFNRLLKQGMTYCEAFIDFYRGALADRNGEFTSVSFIIDESGKKLPVSKQAVLRLPVLTGALPAFKNEMTKDKKNVYYKAFEVIKAIYKDPFMSAMTEQLLVDENKDISIIPKLGNHKIILGDATDLENKFKKLAIFYKEGMPPEGWSLYKEINLKFKNQVVAKKVEGEPIKN